MQVSDRVCTAPDISFYRDYSLHLPIIFSQLLFGGVFLSFLCGCSVFLRLVCVGWVVHRETPHFLSFVSACASSSQFIWMRVFWHHVRLPSTFSSASSSTSAHLASPNTHWEVFSLHIRFPGGSDSKESACNAGDLGSLPGSGDPLEKEMTTHSSILAWKIPWTEEPGELQSMGVLKSQPQLSN